MMSSLNICVTLDVEDQATKNSVEEQMQLTTVQTLEGDLNSGFLSVQSSPCWITLQSTAGLQ